MNYPGCFTEFEPYVEDLRIGDRSSVRQLKLMGTSELLDTVFPDIRWIVPGYVPEGLSILAGRQKLGKTWLALDWAVAVATAGVAMGTIACQQGSVLYVDLENGQRRMQRRLENLLPPKTDRPDLSRLEWAYDAPQLDRGLIPALDRWRLQVDQPRLVVIDVLQRIKPPGRATRNAYENDYSTLAELQRWAMTSAIGVVALHHTRKGGADDPLEALSGSNGISACADTTLLLDRNSSGTSLYVRGRDVEERDSAMEFNSGRWTALGDESDYRLSRERTAILSLLAASTDPLGPQEIAIATGRSRNGIDQLLHKMTLDGQVTRVGRGKYEYAEQISLSQDLSGHGKTDKTDKVDKTVSGFSMTGS